VGSQLSVTQILATLESQLAMHREREAHHAAREVFHREQRALHAAEIEAVSRHYEAFKASAEAAAEIAGRATPPEPAQPAAPPAPVQPVRPSLVVRWVVKTLPPDESFGPTRVTAEAHRLFGAYLKTPLDPRLASTVLRRLHAEGVLRLVKPGKPHQEALYARA
jgi:hypothetical protein